MSTIAALKSWSSGEVLTHTDLNSNFSEIRTTVNTYGMFTDVARTITAIQTFSAVPVFSIGATITTGGLTVSAGGITVTGNSTITGTLGGITTLTATTIAGTLSTAAQPNITSLGTIASLVATAGTITTLTWTTGTPTGASPTICTGSTDLIIKNNAGSSNVARFLSAGGVVLTGTNSASIDVASAGSAIQILAPGSGVILGASGAVATNATGGFPIIPSCNGTPTGAATTGSMVWDSANELLYIRNAGGWFTV